MGIEPVITRRIEKGKRGISSIKVDYPLSGSMAEP
jgi:hypothetical protein